MRYALILMVLLTGCASTAPTQPKGPKRDSRIPRCFPMKHADGSTTICHEVIPGLTYVPSIRGCPCGLNDTPAPKKWY